MTAVKRTFQDVELIENPRSLSLDGALREAARCLQCHAPPCRKRCPANIDIPAFIRGIKERDFLGAAQKIKEENLLGGVCGRVCPVDRLCESECTRKKMDEAIKIGALQYFATDREEAKWKKEVVLQPDRPGKVAVIGAGPAGLSCAFELRKMGFAVKIFEKNPKAGGIPSWGIPSFRVPREIVKSEASFVLRTGVEIERCTEISDIDDLTVDYQAVFVGCGLGRETEFRVKGAPKTHFPSHRFLRLAEEDRLPDLGGKRVGIVGGGDVAFDVARTVVRRDGNPVIIYRRSFTEMPAEREEIELAISEGVDLELLTTVVEVKKIRDTEDGKYGKYRAECQVMTLGEEDGSGRRRPVPVEGSRYFLDLHYLISAIGSALNVDFCERNDLDIGKDRRLKVDDNMMTSRAGVFAGGDVGGRDNLVVRAVADGKRAAQAIASFIGGGN